jgi:hypothetical protein
VHVRDLVVSRELGAEGVRGGVEREVPDIETLTHDVLTFFGRQLEWRGSEQAVLFEPLRAFGVTEE